MHMLSFQLHCISHFHGPENCNAVVGKCPAVLLECLFQSTWLNGKQLFLEVSHKFHNSPTAILKWKRLCKICLFLCSSHFCKVHESQKQTTSSLDWCGCKLMHHLFVWAFFPSNGNHTSINSSFCVLQKLQPKKAVDYFLLYKWPYCLLFPFLYYYHLYFLIYPHT